MKKFTYVIRTDFPMHFGPAGQLAALTRLYSDCEATIEMGTRIANISRPMKVATMGIRKGDQVDDLGFQCYAAGLLRALQAHL